MQILSENVIICCGVSMFGVIGPYLFEDNNQVITADSECYWNCEGRCKGQQMYDFNRLVR
jgi:hypothetical protein